MWQDRGDKATKVCKGTKSRPSNTIINHPRPPTNSWTTLPCIHYQAGVTLDLWYRALEWSPRVKSLRVVPQSGGQSLGNKSSHIQCVC